MSGASLTCRLTVDTGDGDVTDDNGDKRVIVDECYGGVRIDNGQLTAFSSIISLCRICRLFLQARLL